MQQQSLLSSFVSVKKRPLSSSVAATPSSSSAASSTSSTAASSASTLTAEQRELIELKKMQALKRRRAALGVDLAQLLSDTSSSWFEALKAEFEKPYMIGLHESLGKELASQTVLPPLPEVFAAFRLPLSDVRVVILGQDPYPTPGHANGLAFSVHKHVKPLPGSLQNIFSELATDVPDFVRPLTGDLTPWVQRGVLLLNTALSVRAGASNSHADIGWTSFTDAVIRTICAQQKPVVFLLWGKHAQSKSQLILSSGKKHVIVKSVHPSPLSASKGFFGCKCFSAANEALLANGEEPIDWKLTATATENTD
jgi:uracil-DNA glycosylase